MYNLSHAEAQLLFEQNTHREELTPSERMPKYRSVLEELFQLLIHIPFSPCSHFFFEKRLTIPASVSGSCPKLNDSKVEWTGDLLRHIRDANGYRNVREAVVRVWRRNCFEG